jgi:hypothetical protein
MGRGTRSMLILVATLSLVLGSAPLASAVAPANDRFGSATVVGSLPFADALSTVDATYSASDPTGCVGAAHSVWYTYTAGLDGLVAFETYGSDFDTVISAYTGTRGSLQQIACNDQAYSPQSHIKFAVTTGTTYHVMVAGYGYRTVDQGESGELVLSAHTEPPFEMEVSVDGRGTLDPISGIATVGGTAVCSTPGVIRLLEGRIRQRIDGVTVRANVGIAELVCGPDPVAWVGKADPWMPPGFVPGRTRLVHVRWRGLSLDFEEEQVQIDLPKTIRLSWSET